MTLPKMTYRDMPEHLPQRMVEYYHPSWDHGHQYHDILKASAEDMAIGLAEAVLTCNPERHEGHGSHHHNNEAQLAFDAAMEQIERGADEVAYQELREKVRQHEMWGGPVPKLVLYPHEDDPKDWDALVTDDKGVPTIYKAPPELVEDLLPNPTDKNAYKRNGAWRARRKRRAKRIT